MRKRIGWDLLSTALWLLWMDLPHHGLAALVRGAWSVHGKELNSLGSSWKVAAFPALL
jgi:hypothetical protein